MSNNKQSSIDWLIERFYANEGMITTAQLERAKAMHKEEIIVASARGYLVGEYQISIDDAKFYGELYYNETYNTKEK